MAFYSTADDLRDALEVDESTLPDAKAEAILEDASDWIDGQLGMREVDDTTGRKVSGDLVQSWQWTKLVRATLKVAVKLYSSPDTFTAKQWETVKGPDFETTGPRTPSADVFGSDVSALLDQSGLRILTTVLGVGPNRPPWYGFSFNDPDEP